MAIVTCNDFDCVQEMSWESSATQKRTGFAASPGTKNDQLLSRIAADSPAVTQSAVTLLSVMILLRSIYDELRCEKIFLSVCLAQRSHRYLLRKAETSAELKVWVPVAFKRIFSDKKAKFKEQRKKEKHLRRGDEERKMSKGKRRWKEENLFHETIGGTRVLGEGAKPAFGPGPNS